jgi:hypothetical protein
MFEPFQGGMMVPVYAVRDIEILRWWWYTHHSSTHSWCLGSVWDRTGDLGHNIGCNFRCKSLAKARAESIGLRVVFDLAILTLCRCSRIECSGGDRRTSRCSKHRVLWMRLQLRAVESRTAVVGLNFINVEILNGED